MVSYSGTPKWGLLCVWVWVWEGPAQPAWADRILIFSLCSSLFVYHFVSHKGRLSKKWTSEIRVTSCHSFSSCSHLTWEMQDGCVQQQQHRMSKQLCTDPHLPSCHRPTKRGVSYPAKPVHQDRGCLSPIYTRNKRPTPTDRLRFPPSPLLAFAVARRK